MAHHGGRTVPRAHRPRAPTMSVHQAQPLAHHPLTAPLAPLLRTTNTTTSTHHHHLRQQPSPLPPVSAASVTTATTTTTTTSSATTTHVTLQAPRPDIERAANEYVETPFRAPVTAPTHNQNQQQHHAPTDNKSATAPAHVGPPVHRLERPSRLPLVAVTSHQHHQPHLGQVRHHPFGGGGGATTVTKQPVAFTKEHPAVTAASATGGAILGAMLAGDACSNSGNIICSECGRCRCESCRTPRALPSRWVCDNACLCSADTVIDYASCLCCVKALYYHCSDTDAGATCADDPCSCGPHRRWARWACLGALAAVLPCLLCYWPLRGCQGAVEAAYARHSRAGCRCRPHQATPEKRLLDSSPEF